MPANSLTASILDYARDKVTGFLTFMTGDHRYIHEGRAFTYIGNTGSLAAGSGTYSFAITTPVDTSNIRIHFRPVKFSATANTMLMTIAEGSTVSGGTAGTPFNRNRNSATASKVSLSYGVTVTSAGQTIGTVAVGGGANPSNNVGGSGNGNEELVLKPNTTYSIKIENIGTTTASTGYFEVFWYEEAK